MLIKPVTEHTVSNLVFCAQSTNHYGLHQGDEFTDLSATGNTLCIVYNYYAFAA